MATPSILQESESRRETYRKGSMNVVNKIRNVLRGILQGFGTHRIKRKLWDAEFSTGRWDHLESTVGDIVYEYVEKYCRNGSILDLGCGSGNTGNEIDISKYQHYSGVDISDVAVQKAGLRSKSNQRGEKNQYFQSDIISYMPSQNYDVILFRESICYVPRHRVQATLERYSHYLKEGGVFIVRLYDGTAYAEVVDQIERNHKVCEKYYPTPSGTIVLVFR